MTKRTSIAAILMGAVLGFAGAAGAGGDKKSKATDPTGETTGAEKEMAPDTKMDPVSGTTADAKHIKHLGMMDLYLSAAIADLKLLSAFSDLGPADLDKATVAELRKNLDAALMNVDRHLKVATKKMADDPTMTSSLDTMKQQLAQARAASKKLHKAKTADLAANVDTIASHVMAADDEFRKMAESAGFARLETMRLGAMPVGGEEDEELDEMEEPDMSPKAPKEPGSIPDTGKKY
jgi:hypothetical protein